jgi:hypothetical protein
MSKICVDGEGMSTELSWKAIDKAKLKYSKKLLFYASFCTTNPSQTGHRSELNLRQGTAKS